MSIPYPSSPQRPLRLWPGVVIVALQWLVAYGVPFVAPDAEVASLPVGLLAVLGGALGGLATAIWWLFFSRAPWAERIGAVVLMIGAVALMKRLVHESIAGAGMGMLLYISSIPFMSLALVAWAWITRGLAPAARRVALVALVVLATAPWTLLRTGGVGSAGSDLHWRWTPTPEERLLAQADDKALGVAPMAAPVAAPAEAATLPPVPAAATTGAVPESAGVAAAPPVPAVGAAPATRAPEAGPVVASPAAPADPGADIAWPGFRGAGRDSVVRGVRIDTDWTKAPPVELWRRPIGPGWSSFAVQGDRIFTQEQRGDDEVVSAYHLKTGEPVWRHRDAVRFWESNAGAGPRATPTLSRGRVFTFGATGILNALEAGSGAAAWSKNVASDTGRRVPDWGFTSSPLVVDDVVIVAAAGTLVGYDRASGQRRWSGPSYGGSYSSPHRATFGGVVQVLLLGGPGAISVAPATGAVLWEHAWSPGAIVQPALTADGDVLINAIAATGGLGMRRLAVTPGSPGWRVEERWTSTGLKPNFNDFVVHEGHAFGFDGNILACIDLQDGTRKWKGGRYGNGQLVLLADQDVLLVLSEDGELALVSATPDKFTELAKRPAIEGKTWNHPVIVGDVLLVRNGEEMAAFRLTLAGR